METASSNEVYESLRNNYLLVHLLASLADWLQGPYLYRLYFDYGYRNDEISSLYVIGFASAAVSGVLVGHFADTFGRKRLCLIYSLTTTITCSIISITDRYRLLQLARIFGGASTCILCSSFECWYVGEHLSRHRLDDELIADVFAKFTLFNGFLAILAGLSASFLADSLRFGPLAPFFLAVPVSLASGYFCSVRWNENPLADRKNSSFVSGVAKSLDRLLFRRNKDRMLLLAAVQSLFETVMYVFVFLWTPVLDPLGISHGLVFSGFMVCTMIGSFANSLLTSAFHAKPEYLLCLSVFLGTLSIFGSTLGIYLQNSRSNDDEKITGDYVSLASFMGFEVSVGIYYPAIGYLRGIVVPETHRASIANWFRMPSNILVCLSLLYITVESPGNCVIFGTCGLALTIASIATIKFAKIFSRDGDYRSNGVPAQIFVQ